ncbi:hypothetical protein CDAR_417061 [Caerostris darwini]|uniref:Uncharacterized protein n=1 Tax=Caerostris darwini TaxID=1538125 RepID=A0AAV4X8M7_9ARAC|nr:hypothetical protein CDAR_417061 [Caerostris darwini]
MQYYFFCLEVESSEKGCPISKSPMAATSLARYLWMKRLVQKDLYLLAVKKGFQGIIFIPAARKEFLPFLRRSRAVRELLERAILFQQFSSGSALPKKGEKKRKKRKMA